MTAPEFATLTTDDLVTGEAVALDLPPASLGLRIASGLIDVTATLVLLFVVILVASIATLSTDAALATVALIGSIVIVFVVFPTTVETLTRGRSLGKLALGLRTVRDDAGPITFQHAFVRALVGVRRDLRVLRGAGVLLGAAELARQAARRLRRRHVRRPRAGQAPAHSAGRDAAAPRHLGASTPTSTSLPTGLALAVRQYLGRLPDDRPDLAGHDRRPARRRGAQVRRPRAAARTAPEDFLAAVIASRRERDLARLRREAELRQRLTTRR